MLGGSALPSPINPTNDIATETKRIGSIAQPTLRALKHGALVHKVIEHFATLGEKIVQPSLGALQEAVLVECVLLPTGAQHPATEGVFRRLGRCCAFWRGGRGEAPAGVCSEGRAGARGEELCALCRSALCDV